jgi:hypothetical protein
MTTPPPTYSPNPAHRDGTALKSQWTIGPDDEAACFDYAWSEGWVVNDIAWGVHAPGGGVAEDLGKSCDGERILWWAKFRGKNGPWHGYPADLGIRQHHDCPTNSVLKKWLEAGHIDKVAFGRIVRRKPCRPS